MKRFTLRRFALLGALLLLHACTSLPIEPEVFDDFGGNLKVLLGSFGGDSFAAGTSWSGTAAAGNGTLEQVNVHINGAATQIVGGMRVGFDHDVGTFDLLQLRDREFEVVDAELVAGSYDWVEVSLDPARSNAVVGGETRTLHLARNPVRIDGPFVVPAHGAVTVRLEFDLDASVIANADGSYTLDPVIVVTVN